MSLDPLKPGDLFLALPGGNLHQSCRTLPVGEVIIDHAFREAPTVRLRIACIHPCGAVELTVLSLEHDEEDDA